MIIDILKAAQIIRKTPKGEYTNLYRLYRNFKRGIWVAQYEFVYQIDHDGILRTAINCYFGYSKHHKIIYRNYNLSDPNIIKQIRQDYRAIRTKAITTLTAQY